MSKLNVGPVGVALNVSPDDAYLDEAVELEQLGYSGIWLPGGQIDSLDRIAALLGATTAIPVGSAIISPDVYDAAAVTALYADLQETAPDRFIVGLGGPQQPPSMRALNDYLDELGDAKTPVPAQRRISGRTRSAQAQARTGSVHRSHRAAGHAQLHRCGAAHTRC